MNIKGGKVKKRYLIIWTGIIAILFMLSACGGSSGNEGDGTTSSNWDQMKWDQGKWQ